MINTESINIRQFDQAISSVTPEFKNILMSLDAEIKERCKEIRLIADQPVSIYSGSNHFYLNKNGSVGKSFLNAYKCSQKIINDTYLRACRYSVHSYHSDIIKGFITVEGGHRIGLCGTAAVDSDGKILSVRDISSVNIRISHEMIGCSDKILKCVNSETLSSFIIIGPPSSGKTTVLRDAVRNLSDSGYKISLIDERNEIACTHNGKRLKNVGVNTDVFNSYPKEIALNLALRTMSPDYIAIDEVCEESEISAIKAAVNCGVNFIVTVHASSFDEVISSIRIISMINSDAFNKIVLLDRCPETGLFNVFDIGEIKNEINRRRNCVDMHSVCRLQHL